MELAKLRQLLLSASPEWIVASTLLAIAVALQVTLRAPLAWLSAVKILAHVAALSAGYILIAIFLWLVLRAGRRQESKSDIARRLGQQVSDAFCFELVLTVSLYIKLLVPLIRSDSYDRLYESIDRTWFAWLDPMIAWRARSLQFNWLDTLYFFLFFGMFFVSFIVHNLRGRAEFRRVLLATLLVQALGGVLYLAAPAIGPFLYHPSANVLMGATEHYFYMVHQAEMAGGARWLSTNASLYLDFGLAAMPSLHAAGSFVFLYYAWRYVRWLGWVYLPAFAWILFEAMATRWHFGIDLIAGLMLGCVCIFLTEKWVRAHGKTRPTAAESSPHDSAIATTN